MPLTAMCLCRKAFSRSRPGSSSPTMPTGRTFTSRSARLLMAFAPPPGTMVRSRCFSMSTGASLETREISPYTNSSATRSASTVTVTFGKTSRIFLSRSPSLGCLIIRVTILSCPVLPLADGPQNGIHDVSRVHQIHFHGHDCEGVQGREIAAQVDGVFLGGHETFGFAPGFKGEQFTDVVFRVEVMISVNRLRDRFDS